MVKVIIYSTPTCGWCRLTVNYMDEKEVKYEYIDVSRDAVAYNLIFEKTGQRGVPVTNINGTYIVGYAPHKFDKLLTIR